ncbi:MAG: 2-dehydropantoate 2-reductase [Deltaproteobacteria bacterium]|nr:2-dehydropantoate 2-reductase [Deltaproteobacteria bacterium]
MRILVLGAGALGGLFGARLAEAGQDVTLLEVNVARARLLAEEGLFLSEADKGERQVRLKVVTSCEGMEPVDLLFVAVKSYQTEDAVRAGLPAMGPRTWILSTQNGIGNVERIRKVAPRARVLTGITYHSIQHTGPNRMRYRTGVKPIQMSPAGLPIDDEVRAIGAMFNAAGLKCEVVERVDDVVWQKLVHNAVVNPVSALTGMSCSELLEDEDMQTLMRGLCLEIAGVMQARGTPLEDPQDPYVPIVRSQKALAKNRPSMWQDLVRGFRTEIDAMNGGVVDEAERLGMKAPLNWAIVQLIHSRERQARRKQEKGAETLAQVKASQGETPVKPLGRSRFGGMPSGRVPLESAPRLKEIVHGYYTDLAAAGRDPDRHVAWCSALGPVEIVRAMGYTPYFPENNAALIGASRLTGRYITKALADGFSPFANSEMTSDIGATMAGESPLASLHGLEAIPRPEVLVYSTNLGRYIGRWFQFYANRMKAPLLGLNPPTDLDAVEKAEIDCGVQQMLRMVQRLEKLSGRQLSQDRLAEVVERSARAARLWSEILDLACQVPSPLTYFDTLIHVAPILLMRGTEEAVQYYEILLSELKQRVAAKVAAVPGERMRVYWEGPPVWCALRPLASLFLDQGIAVVASTYGHNYAFEGLQPQNPIESMAEVYTSIYENRSREYKVRYLAREFERFGVEAAVFHDARTSPEHSGVRHGVHMRLQRDTGIPAIVFEGDTHDLRLVSVDHIRGQLQEFLEVRRSQAGRHNGLRDALTH